MNARIAALVALTAHMFWDSSSAAETITSFKPLCAVNDCSVAPLRNVSFKTVLLEFFDPTASELSEPLTYLWYRQIYDSISDVPKAGIERLIKAEREQEREYAQTLISNSRGDHNLADSLASNSDAQLAVWGTLLSLDKSLISYAPSITAPTAADTGWLRMPGGAVSNATQVPAPFVKLGRVNLSARTASLVEHYGTSVTVRCARDGGCPEGTILLQYEPNARASGLSLSDGERLHVDISDSRKPTGKHVPVKRASDGRMGWVYMYDLSLVPEQAYVSSRSSVPVYAGPSTRSPRMTTVTGPATWKVLDAPLIGDARSASRWYRIELQPSLSGWVQFGAVRPVWAADFVHFVAGVQHYGRGRFNGAHDEMELFVRRANQEEDNVAISIAYEIMAASVIASRREPSFSDINTARDYVSASVQATPFDSRSFYMRAFATLAWRPAQTLTSEAVASIKQDVDAAEKYLLDTDEELESALKRMEGAVAR